jgi:hypothetical protein
MEIGMSSDLIGTKRLFSNASSAKIVGATADQANEHEVDEPPQKRPKQIEEI